MGAQCSLICPQVVTALGSAGRFETGPLLPSYDRPFVVRDDNLISARWPGDAAGWAEALVEAITSTDRSRLSAK